MVVCYTVYNAYFFLQFVALFRCNWNFFFKKLGIYK